MLDIAVIEDPAAAEASLDPVRALLLAELTQPSSATMLAGRVGLPRQKVNYHLRALERHGLVELVEERRKGNVTERVMRATAASYVISPTALASVQPDPARSPDRLSAYWLLAVAARLVRDVGALIVGAARARRRVATFAMDGEVRFATPADRAAFAEELASTVATLLARYHDTTAVGGRDHRVIVAIHPSVKADMVESEEEGILTMANPFEVRKQIEVQASPDVIWDAITTGEGMDGWFVGTGNEVERRLGGTVRLAFGGEIGVSTVTTWEPPRHFAHRGEVAPDGSLHAMEYVIEAPGRRPHRRPPGA